MKNLKVLWSRVLLLNQPFLDFIREKRPCISLGSTLCASFPCHPSRSTKKILLRNCPSCNHRCNQYYVFNKWIILPRHVSIFSHLMTESTGFAFVIPHILTFNSWKILIHKNSTYNIEYWKISQKKRILKEEKKLLLFVFVQPTQ